MQLAAEKRAHWAVCPQRRVSNVLSVVLAGVVLPPLEAALIFDAGFLWSLAGRC